MTTNRKNHALRGFFCYTIFIMEAEQTLSLGKIGQSKPKKKSAGGLIIKILFLLILFAVLVTVAVIAVLRSEKYQFKSVTVFGTTTFSADDIVAFTHEYWDKNHFKSIKQSSTILFSKDDFESELKKQFPVISVAYVTLPEPDKLEIHIQERKPNVTWCFADDTCGFVNEQGILYAKAPKFSEGVYVTFQSQLNDPSYKKFGTVVLEPAIMNRFTELFLRLETNEIGLSKIMFYEDGDVGFSIDKLFGVYTNNSSRLLGTFGQDDEVFVRDMITGLSNDAFKRQFIANPKDLDYIDMRFPGKIFYKFISNQKPVENTAEIIE